MQRTVPADMETQVLRAAEVFAAKGYDESRMEDLVDATGIPRATLYYYFSGKQDLLSYLMHWFLQRVHDGVRRAARGPGPPMTRLVDVVHVELEILDQNPDLSIVLVAHFARAGRLPDLADDVDAAFHEPVRSLLEEARDDGTVSLDDLETTTVALFGSVLIPGVHYLLTGRSIPVDRATADIARIITRGLTA